MSAKSKCFQIALSGKAFCITGRFAVDEIFRSPTKIFLVCVPLRGTVDLHIDLYKACCRIETRGLLFDGKAEMICAFPKTFKAHPRVTNNQPHTHETLIRSAISANLIARDRRLRNREITAS